MADGLESSGEGSELSSSAFSFGSGAEQEQEQEHYDSLTVVLRSYYA